MDFIQCIITIVGIADKNPVALKFPLKNLQKLIAGEFATGLKNILLTMMMMKIKWITPFIWMSFYISEGLFSTLSLLYVDKNTLKSRFERRWLIEPRGQI